MNKIPSIDTKYILRYQLDRHISICKAARLKIVLISKFIFYIKSLLNFNQNILAKIY